MSTKSFARSAQTATPKDSDSGAALSDARPDPVGGIRTGTWEGALDVGPWGDRRQGAFFIAYGCASPQGARGCIDMRLRRVGATGHDAPAADEQPLTRPQRSV
ncbi:hypothetical protein GCM10018780_17140 [Streptomyces lanatus]|nr:hypothetical protein GCM10018780_17140 [Streptomyces lanatus]